MAKKTKKVDKKSKASTKPAAKAKAAPKPAKKVAAKAVKKVAPVAKKKPAKVVPPKKAAKPVAAAKPAKKEAKVKGAEVQKLEKLDKKVLAKSVDGKEKKAKAAPAEKTPAPDAKAKKGKKETDDAEQEVVLEAKAPVKDVVLTDAEGRELCRVKDCDQPWVVEGYCRYHYLLFWKKIQNRKKILSEGKLEQYIEELTSRYPLKFLELIRKDLSSEPDFFSAIQELDIDESNNIDEFEDENFMEEVRGISSGETERVDDEY